MITTAEQIKIANKTARSKGASVFDDDGNIRSAVAQYVPNCAYINDKILDFGCGPAFIQGAWLNEKGFNVDGYDFGDNALENNAEIGLHNYDVVYASNVLNVQSSGIMLYETLLTIKSCMKNNAKLICNYPASPRKLQADDGYVWSADDVENLLTLIFGRQPRVVGGSKSAPVWRIDYVKDRIANLIVDLTHKYSQQMHKYADYDDCDIEIAAKYAEACVWCDFLSNTDDIEKMFELFANDETAIEALVECENDDERIEHMISWFDDMDYADKYRLVYGEELDSNVRY